MKVIRMGDIGARLKEERLRLGLSQEAFAALADASKPSQVRYENGGRSPDADYLLAIHEAGADLLYILTGERSMSPAPLPSADDLPPRLRARLAAAIEAVEAGLDATGRVAPPAVKAGLVMAAYDILARDAEAATAQIIRLVTAA